MPSDQLNAALLFLVKILNSMLLPKHVIQEIFLFLYFTKKKRSMVITKG